MDLSFKGAVVRLSDTDLPRIGFGIGVGEDEIHAFLDVETAGGGYDDQGRPKMLFEPHVLYRNLAGKERDRAVAAGIAYARWGEKPYPKDSYPRLVQAIAINEAAALKSASWGIGQVMGENFVAAGFASPEDMVAAMVNGGEAAQLQAAVNFINGQGYAKNGYDKKLAGRFAWWQGKPDTPWSPPSAADLDAAGKTNICPSCGKALAA